MRNLKFAVFSMLIMLAISVFITSCEKEVIPSTENLEFIEEDVQDDFIPLFSQKIQIRGNGSTEGYSFTFDVGSNNLDLLKSFNQSSLSVDFMDIDAIEKELGKGNSDASDLSTLDRNEEEEDLITGRKFVTIAITEVISPKPMDIFPTHKLSLSDEILTVIKNANAITVFDFGPIKTSTTARWGSETLWNNNKCVAIVGDNYPYGNGTRLTKTNNYWDYWGNDLPSKKLNRSYFGGYDITSVCCTNQASSGTYSRWVRRVAVVQDVVKDAYGFSNNCPYSGDPCWNGYSEYNLYGCYGCSW